MYFPDVLISYRLLTSSIKEQLAIDIGWLRDGDRGDERA